MTLSEMKTSFLRSSCSIRGNLRFGYDRRPCRPARAKTDFVELHDGRVVERDLLDMSSEELDAVWNLDFSGESVCRSSTGLNVVLVHPQIPQNTGCTARTCAAACVPLHLVEPLGFDTDSRKLKRGGLDFWPYVVVKVHTSWNAFVDYYNEQQGAKRMIGFTKYGERNFWEPEFSYKRGDWLIFGSETTGLPPEAHEEISKKGSLLKIPMLETHVRCLNLSVSVGIGLYEAKRQLETGSTQPIPDAITQEPSSH